MKSIVISMALVTGLVSLNANAQPGPPPWAGKGGRFGAGPGLGLVARSLELNLSGEQREAIAALRTEMAPKLLQARQEMRRIRAENHQLRAGATPSWERLAELRVEMDQARSTFHGLRDELHGRLLSLLTPEQRAALWVKGQQDGMEWSSAGGRGPGRGRGRGRGGWGRGGGRGRWGRGAGGPGYGYGGGY